MPALEEADIEGQEDSVTVLEEAVEDFKPADSYSPELAASRNLLHTVVLQSLHILAEIVKFCR